MRVPDGWLERVDEARGSLSRSAFVKQAVDRHLGVSEPAIRADADAWVVQERDRLARARAVLDQAEAKVAEELPVGSGQLPRPWRIGPKRVVAAVPKREK